LAKIPAGQSSLWLHHKIEKKNKNKKPLATSNNLQSPFFPFIFFGVVVFRLKLVCKIVSPFFFPLQFARWRTIMALIGDTFITRGVSHCGLAIYIKKYHKPKEELWKLKYFTMQNYNLQKILYKKPKSFKIL
jgi:hypothetical protein